MGFLCHGRSLTIITLAFLFCGNTNVESYCCSWLCSVFRDTLFRTILLIFFVTACLRQHRVLKRRALVLKNIRLFLFTVIEPRLTSLNRLIIRGIRCHPGNLVFLLTPILSLNTRHLCCYPLVFLVDVVINSVSAMLTVIAK